MTKLNLKPLITVKCGPDEGAVDGEAPGSASAKKHWANRSVTMRSDEKGCPLTSGERVVFLVGLVMAIAGAIGWVMQLTGGLLAGSAMTNIFLWGLMIAVFAFLVGFGAGAQLVATAIYLWGCPEWRPFAKCASAVGLACVCAAGVAILADLGAIRNVMSMIVGLNLRSPLAWDMIAISAFIVCSAVALIMLIKDAPAARIWVILAGLAAVALQIVEGLLFATQTAHPWWATPIMPVDFLVVAFVSGSALLMTIAFLKKEPSNFVAWLGRLCALAIALHLVLALTDLALVATSSSPVEKGILQAVLAHPGLYGCELGLPAVAMVLLFTLGRSGKTGSVLLAGLLVIAGIFCHRLMLLYPAYNAPSLYLKLSGTDITTGAYPISTGRYLDWDIPFAEASAYVPNGLEWLAALLPVGVAIVGTLVLVGIVKFFSRKSTAHPHP